MTKGHLENDVLILTSTAKYHLLFEAARTVVAKQSHPREADFISIYDINLRRLTLVMLVLSS
jgi:hypothetical protein